MTTRIFWYFFFYITRTIVIVMGIIIGLFFVLTFLENLGDDNANTFIQILRDTILEMPQIIHAALPICAALGCAVALALLDGKRELALMRIVGISSYRILMWIVATSLIWVIAYVSFNEYVMPKTASINRDLEIQKSGSLITAAEDIWLKTSDGFAKIGIVTPSGTSLRDLWTVHSEDSNVTMVRKINRAYFLNNRWELNNIQEARIENGSWLFATHDKLIWEDGPNPEVLTSFSIPPSNLEINKLLDLSKTLKLLDQNTVHIDLIIWSRLFDALMIAGLMLCTYIFVGFRTKADVGAIRTTTVLALIMVLLYYYFQLIVKQYAIDNNLAGHIGAAMPILGIVILLAVNFTYKRMMR